MAEVAATPVVRSQSVSSPAAKVVTPTPAAPTAPAPVVSVVDETAAKMKRLELAYNTTMRKSSEERRAWESEKKTLSERAAKAAEYEKREQMARLDPPSYLKSLYGDDWTKTLNEMVANGGAPPAQLIQAEMQKLRDEMEAKYKARDDEAAKRGESQREQAAEQARRGIFAEAASFYRENGKDYPILAKLGGDAAVARTIANRIEAEFNRTVKFDADGSVSEQGRILTTSEAADLIESEVLDWVTEASKHEKYKAKLTPAAPGGTVAPSKKPQDAKPQARRSITNDITGSTSATKPPASDAERRDRATKAFEEARARRQG
jgi:hypothetical protein